MNRDTTQRNDLPDSLRGIVEGIIADPIPTDLKQRVRSRLAGQLKPPVSSFGVKTYLALASAAALLVTVGTSLTFLTTNSARSITASDDRRAEPERVISVRRLAQSGPSLWAYRQAANESPDQLDRLLAEHAGSILVPNQLNSSESIRAFVSQPHGEI